MKYLRRGKKSLALLLALALLVTNVQWTMITADAAVETELSVSWSNTTLTYDGTQQCQTATITLADNTTEVVVNELDKVVSLSENLTVKMTTDATSADAGTYNATLTLSGSDSANYKLSDESKSYVIGKKSLASASAVITLEDGPYYYTGSAIEPAVKSVVVDGVIWSTSDYSVSYESNTAVGTGTVKVTATTDGTYSKNYADSASTTFTITNISASDATLNGTRKDGASDNWYAGDVTITPPNGYTISTDRTNWMESLVYTTSQSGTITYYLKDSSDGYISAAKTIGGFNIDATNPVIGDISVSEEWASSKMVTVPVTEDNVQSVTCVDEYNKAIDIEGSNGSYSFTLTDNHDEDGKTYTITVIDNAGNKTTEEVTVTKIDSTLPEITVKQGESSVASEGKVYVNAETEFSVAFTAGESGIDVNTLEITKDDVSVEALVWDDSNSTTLTFTPSGGDEEEVEYKITGKNGAGEDVSMTFTVIYDVVEPKLTSFTISDTANTPLEGSYLYAKNDTSQDDIIVKFEIDENEDFITRNVVVKYLVDETGEWVTVSNVDWDEDNVVASFSFDGVDGEDHTYQFQVSYTDLAGNEMVTDLTGASKAGDAITHGTYVVIDHKDAAVSASISEEESGVWTQSKTVNVTVDENNVDSVTYQATDVSETALTLDEGVASFEVTDELAASGRDYTITVTDKAGNVVTTDINVNKIDTTAPDTNKIYISVDYDEDEESKEPVDFVTNIFAKDKATVYVFIQDPKVDNATEEDDLYSEYASGVSSIGLTYKDETKLWNKVSNISMIDTETSAEINDETYDVFATTISTNAEEIVSAITITDITDAAGNVSEINGASVEIESDNLLFLDDVNPVLTSVGYAGESVELVVGDGDYWFYNATQNIPVVITETNFFATLSTEDGAEYASTPELTALTNTFNVTAWEAVEDTNTATSTYTFEEGNNQELEYSFTLGYVDPSGNVMTGTGVDNYGDYTSDTIVIDTIAPELVAFAIEGGEDSVTDGNILYAENLDGDDITITVTIDDNASYFDSSAVVVEYAVADSEDWTALTGSTWTVDDRNHTATYTFDGDVDEATYEFRVSYADRAGNAMVTALENVTKDSETDGTFLHNTQVVINHDSPELVDFSIVGSEGDILEDGLLYASNINGNDVTLSVSIDTNPEYFNEDAVVLEYSSDDWATAATLDVTGDGWSEDGNVLSASYEFDGEDGKDVTYEFRVSYVDRSSNAMVTEIDTVEDDEETAGTFVLGTKAVIDKVAPKLVTFELQDTEYRSYTDEIAYAENIDGTDDMIVWIGIEDTASYFADDSYKGVVKVEYSMDGTTWSNVTDEAITWTSFSGVYLGSYTFDGEVDEATYQFRVSYTDRAGNAMVEYLDGTIAASVPTAGTFLHDTSVVIDHKAPEMTAIAFDTPVSIYDEDATAGENGTEVDEITDGDTRAYYAEDVEVTFTLEDGYLFEDECEVIVYSQANRDAIWATTKASVTVTDGVYSFTIPATDSEYYFTVSYTDRAGNVMIYSSELDTAINESYDDGMVEGTYTAPIIVVDTTDPVIDVTYTTYDTYSNVIDSDLSIAELDPYQNGAKVVATVTVTEENLELDETYVVVTQEDINGNDIGDIDDQYSLSWAELIENGDAVLTNDTTDTYVLTIVMDKESIYTIEAYVEDKVEKITTYANTGNIYVDSTAPVIDADVDVDGIFTTDSDIQYTTVNTGVFANIINKLTFGYFANEQVKVTITAHDSVSGVQSITYTYDSDENESGSNPAAVAVEEKDMTISTNDKGEATITFTLPYSFKGTIEAYGTDNSSNVANASSGLGVISETEAKDAKTADASVTVITQEAKTENYYNTDVVVQYSVYDTYSGLNLVQYVAGSVAIADADYSTSGVSIETSEIVKNYTIVSSLNNNNNVETALSFTDNAGYTTTVAEEDLPTIHIDTTAPVIDVTYDNNSALNENYYDATRTATVTITERNFDPNDTELTIEGSGVVVSGWSHSAGSGCTCGNDSTDTGHTDSCTWTCTVAFTQDGDYSFTCSTTDLAGNTTDYGQVDEFTIDMTDPTIDVTYDNDDSTNSYYYNAKRTATITIVEHNFNASEVEVSMTASDNGSSISTPSVSGWSTSGDVHTATITFDYDGEFTLDVAYADLAGNEAADFEEDHFVVDLILPVIEIYDIEDMSANNGVVAPGINITDTNYDLNSVVVTLVGANNGVVEFANVISAIENGENILYEDIPKLAENDDLYTLTVTATDMAGNIFEATVTFSVNRFGSVYILSEETEQLTEDYYAKEEITLHVQEINVDTLVFQEITYTKDSEVVTLEAGVDYTVEESGSSVSWKSYEYTINKENFETEGTYVITISSEDSATNIMNNKMLEADIEFAIDKTAPSTVVTGVVNDEQYNASTRDLLVDAKDNMSLAAVYVYINGDETVLEFKDEELTDTNGAITVALASANDWQTVKVVSVDSAGNTAELDEITYLITTSVFFQWYRNTVLFYGSIVGAVLVLAGGYFFIVGKKKKKKEEK